MTTTLHTIGDKKDDDELNSNWLQGLSDEEKDNITPEQQAKINEIALNFIGEMWMNYAVMNAQTAARIERLAELTVVNAYNNKHSSR